MGLEVAKLLVKKGASVVIISRSVEKLKAAASEIEKEITVQPGEEGGEETQRVGWFSADLTKASEVERVFREVGEWWGKNDGVPDIVWTCAGENLILIYFII